MLKARRQSTCLERCHAFHKTLRFRTWLLFPRIRLDIIAFVLCLAKEDCSLLRLLLLVIDLDVAFFNSSSPALVSECFEVFPDSSTLSRSESSPDLSKSSWWWRSVRIKVYSLSSNGSGEGVKVAFRSRRFSLHRHQGSFCFLVSFRSLKITATLTRCLTNRNFGGATKRRLAVPQLNLLVLPVLSFGKLGAVC